MRCPQCGAALVVGAPACGRCGAAVGPPLAESARVTQSPTGLPIQRYAPSPYGPPVDDDRPQTRVTLAEVDDEARQAFGYRPVELPPPPPSRHGRGRLAAICAVIALALILPALVVTHAFPGLFHLAGSPVALHSPTQTAAAPGCFVSAVDPVAATHIAHPQLSTGVRDITKNDYRPVDAVTVFTSYQTIYLTFEIATNQPGAVDIVFCAPGTQALGQLAIPARSVGRYAGLAMIPGSANIGHASVTVRWDGAVAASLPFTISR